jgi:hypothetical protein
MCVRSRAHRRLGVHQAAASAALPAPAGPLQVGAIRRLRSNESSRTVKPLISSTRARARAVATRSVLYTSRCEKKLSISAPARLGLKLYGVDPMRGGRGADTDVGDAPALQSIGQRPVNGPCLINAATAAALARWRSGWGSCALPLDNTRPPSRRLHRGRSWPRRCCLDSSTPWREHPFVRARVSIAEELPR